MNLRKQQLGIYLAILTIGTGVGIAGNRYWHSTQSSNNTNPVVPVSLNSTPTSNTTTTYPEKVSFIAKAVEKVGPAVVRIDADRLTTSLPDSLSDPWRHFFDKDSSTPKENYEHGTGSGFIVSTDGRLLTNAHVVDGAETVKVTLSDGRVFTGKVIGRDTVTDVAVVKIDADNLPTVTFGKSEKLVPGEWAIAIGNPFGLDNTVTVGIISALERSSSEVGVPNKRVSFIQTDAAINPGNSGGPLLNADGEVIGINTAIRADAQGLGFAIPIEIAQRVANQLVSKGKADHPYLGIHMTTLNAQVREELTKSKDKQIKITADRGVLIADVIADSPAEKAGLKIGDVIRKVGGKIVITAAQVQEKVQASSIDEDLSIEIDRQGTIKVIAVKPTNFPQSQ
jgi:S1-C subfamily serine protease